MQPSDGHGTRGSVGTLLSREAGSGAAGHVVAPETSQTGRQGLERWNTWLHRSPREQGGRVRSRVTRGSAGAHLGREAGSKAAGHMTVHGCMPFSSSWFEAYIRGYPVCGVSTFTYLGLPLGTTKPTIQDFMPMLTRIDKRLMGLASLTSYSGRLTNGDN
jgi:hypothetical protein